MEILKSLHPHSRDNSWNHHVTQSIFRAYTPTDMVASDMHYLETTTTLSTTVAQRATLVVEMVKATKKVRSGGLFTYHYNIKNTFFRGVSADC